MPSSSAVRFGLIGYGAWGAHHAAAIRKHATLAAVCAATPDSRTRAGRDLGADVAICERYQDLLARDDLDVVDIVVPNHLHREVACAALAAGKHVLLEKPMAASVEDCRAIADAARAAHRLLAIGHEARLSSQWGKIKHLIDAGAIGTPVSAAIHLSRFPYRLGSSGWRYDRSRVGSWTLEEPVHYFDLVRWYLESTGPPEAIYARANSVKPDERADLYDNLATLISFPNGAYATVTQTLAAYEYHLRGEVIGTHGAIRTWWGGELDRTERPRFAFEYFNGTTKHEIQLESTPGELFELETEVQALAAAVMSGATTVPSPLVDAQAGEWAVRLCLAAEESARSGAPVRF